MEGRDIIKEYAYIQRLLWYNDNNICYLAPFWYNGATLEIKTHFYNYWNSNDTIKRLEKNGFKCVRVDKTSGSFDSLTFNSDIPDWYWKVYHICLQRSDASQWYHLIPNAHIVYIPDLMRYSIIREELIKIVQLNMDSYDSIPDNGWFVKTTKCSTKHDFKPYPVFTATEAVCQILDSKTSVKAIRNGANIMFRPWIKEISPNNEVRVFVREEKVVAVSQQYCYNILPMLNMINERDMIVAAQKCYDKISIGLSQEHGFQDECTFDAYITFDNEGYVNMHLIEINSGMFGWGPAGSALFSWTHNPPPGVTDPAIYIIAAAF